MANVIFEIVLIIILIVLTGILSMAELAVVSTKKAKLEKLLNEGHKSAQIIIDFAEDPNQFLSTVQIGITLIGILTGAYGGATLAEPLSEVIGPYVPYSGTISILVVVIITTYLTLVIGEIVPKVIALNNPEKVSLKLAKSMSVLSKVCKPISAVLAKSTDFVLWTIGMKSKSESIVTEEEIELLIEEGREDGTIEKEEEEPILDIAETIFETPLEIDPDTIFRTGMFDKFLSLEQQLIKDKYLDQTLNWIAKHDKTHRVDIKSLIIFLVGLLENKYFLPGKNPDIRLFFETRYKIKIGQNFESKRREPLQDSYKVIFYDYGF